MKMHDKLFTVPAWQQPGGYVGQQLNNAHIAGGVICACVEKAVDGCG